MLVFSLFFGRLARMPSDGLPYPVFALAGLVPWMFFSFGLNEAANSVVASRHLITKVYFPRLAVPLAPVLAGLVDFAIAFVLLFMVMGVVRHPAWSARPVGSSLRDPGLHRPPWAWDCGWQRSTCSTGTCATCFRR